MNLNEIANLLTLDNNIDKESLYSIQKNTELKFHECLINAGYSEEEIEAEKIRDNLEERLNKFSFGSSNISLNVSPAVYKKMASNSKFKKKMDEIFDDFLSENGELSWMTKEARAGGGEISLTVDARGNTTYTGKLYCIPGWEKKDTSSHSSSALSQNLRILLSSSNSSRNISSTKHINIKNISYANSTQPDINTLAAVSQLYKINSFKNKSIL